MPPEDDQDDIELQTSSLKKVGRGGVKGVKLWSIWFNGRTSYLLPARTPQQNLSLYFAQFKFNNTEGRYAANTNYCP